MKCRTDHIRCRIFDSGHSDNIPVGRAHLQKDKTFCCDVISHIMHFVKVWNEKFLKV